MPVLFPSPGDSPGSGVAPTGQVPTHLRTQALNHRTPSRSLLSLSGWHPPPFRFCLPGPQACRETAQTGHQSSSEAWVWGPAPLPTTGTHPSWDFRDGSRLNAVGSLTGRPFFALLSGKTSSDGSIPTVRPPIHHRARGPTTHGCSSPVLDPEEPRPFSRDVRFLSALRPSREPR
jgi:hypothetical protein